MVCRAYNWYCQCSNSLHEWTYWKLSVPVWTLVGLIHVDVLWQSVISDFWATCSHGIVDIEEIPTKITDQDQDQVVTHIYSYHIYIHAGMKYFSNNIFPLVWCDKRHIDLMKCGCNFTIRRYVILYEHHLQIWTMLHKLLSLGTSTSISVGIP